MFSFQLQVFEKVSPRCLGEGISSIITRSVDTGGGRLNFLPRNQHRLCFTWVTRQLFAHIEMALRSLFRSYSA